MEFKSLPQLLDYFKDEETCIRYYEQMRWNGNPICPHCGSEKPYVTNRGYKCSDIKCRKKFTVKVGTIFENSKISFRIWFAALFLANSHKKGVSSTQLARDLGITQKTAWFVLHRLRVMFENVAPRMLRSDTILECDETHVGGKEKNRHWRKKRSPYNYDLANDGTPYRKKAIVLGIIERGGNVILKRVASRSEYHLTSVIHRYVRPGSTLITDDHTAYSNIKYTYNHGYTTHSTKNYVMGNIYTNTVESFWSVLKRGIMGVYHAISDKHLDRYLAEFQARYNFRHLSTTVKFQCFLEQSEGRLLYKNLIL